MAAGASGGATGGISTKLSLPMLLSLPPTVFEGQDFSTHRFSASPPHQSAALTASPPGEAYATTVRWDYYCGIFLHKPYRFCQRLPLGVQLSGGQLEIKSKNSFALKVGRPEAGSDEGVR